MPAAEPAIPPKTEGLRANDATTQKNKKNMKHDEFTESGKIDVG